MKKPTDKKMICPHCNAFNKNGAKFCKNCGNQLINSSVNIELSQSNNPLSIICITVIICAVVIGGVLMYMNSNDSSVTIEFDDKFKSYTSDGEVWQQTGSKDIGNGDIIGMCYVEGFSDQDGKNYPFGVQGYTNDGPGLIHHTITKVVYYYEENGQTFTETIDGESSISIEPPKKPIKAVVYYN